MLRSRDLPRGLMSLFRTETTRDLRCMSYMGKDYSSIIIAGHQNVMLKVDVEKGQVVEEVNSQSNCDDEPLAKGLRFLPSIGIP